MAKASSPDLPRHFQYRNAVYQNLADEILNSAIKQEVTLFKADILITLQTQLNPVLDNIILNASNFSPCPSTNEECINAEFLKLQNTLPKKVENRYFDFYNYQELVWTKIFIAPKQGWQLLNEWYPQFINLHFGLAYDTLANKGTNEFYLNSRVMFYRLKEELFPNERHYSKSLFAAYYNHCVHVLRTPSIISYEFFYRSMLIDSVLNIVSEINTGDSKNREDIANIYIACAFNDNFPAGVTKNDIIEMFKESDKLLKKALTFHESGKVHYGLGALYNNFLVDYIDMFTEQEKLDLFGKNIIPSQIEEESIAHLQRACELDEEFCNLRKFKDKTKGKSLR